MVAGLALVGFLVVAVVLPQMAGAEAKDAAQALVAGAERGEKQVSAARREERQPRRLGQGREGRARRTIPSTAR